MKVMHTHQGTVHIGTSYQITSSYMEHRPTIKQRKLCRSTWHHLNHHLNHHLHKGDFTTDDIDRYLDSMSIMEEYTKCNVLWDLPIWSRITGCYDENKEHYASA